jgi:dGTPase
VDGGFRHYDQSLRVVDRIERDGRGLNLTYEVRNGIVRHTVNPPADTLEGRVVKLSDKIAYINHDVDDAIRAGIIGEKDLPGEITGVLGTRSSVRLDTIIKDVIANSTDKDDIYMSPEMYFVVETFHNFMYDNVYLNPIAKSEESKVSGILGGIFEHYMKNPEKLPAEYRAIAEADGLQRAVSDYVSGMTDKYAMYVYGEVFIPAAWQVR